MATEILSSSCAVAQYRGTIGTPKYILDTYARDRNTKLNRILGATNAHTFVVMTFAGQSVEDRVENFIEYVKSNELGKVVRTDTELNINHSGWFKRGNSNINSDIIVCVFTPEHEKLTEWMKREVDENYELK